MQSLILFALVTFIYNHLSAFLAQVIEGKSWDDIVHLILLYLCNLQGDHEYLATLSSSQSMAVSMINKSRVQNKIIITIGKYGP